MHYICKIIFSLAVYNFFIASSWTQTVNMHLWATGENHNVTVKTVPLLDNYTIRANGDDVFNRYGSDSRIKTDATGFFYTKKINGRWWLIDPDGYAGVNMAVTSMPDMTESKANWAYSLLRKNGYNGTGNFLSKEDMTKRLFNEKSFEKMSYTRRKNFFQNYRIQRQSVYSTPEAVKKNPQNYITVFDPEFESFADNFASSFTNYRNERDLLGYFSDNEINFTEDQLKLFLTVLPNTDPNYQAAINYLDTKGLDKNWVIANYDHIPDIRNEFLTLIMDRYFSVVTAAIRKYDPNHLYLGTRLHGKPRDSETVVTVASKYCDIVSVNYYNYVFPRDQICNPAKWGKWLQKYDKPAMVTEFYAKAYNASYPEQPGAGFYTDDQNGRGIFYQSTCLDLIRSGYYVGWQYFRWQDDPPPAFSNKGIVNSNDEEYTDMTAYMEELNRQVYYLIDYVDGNTYEDNAHEIILPVYEDTFIQISGSDQSDVQGNNSRLSLSVSPSSSGVREIFLKFDLQQYYDSLHKIADAKIRLYYLSGDNNQKLTVYGVKDNNWNEQELSGISAQASSGLRDGYGKGRMKTFDVSGINTPIYLNVRNWLLGEISTPIVTFRIVSENPSLYASYWASKEYEDTLLRPVLILTLKNDETTALPVNQQFPDVNIVVRNQHLYVTGLNETAYYEIISLSGQTLQSGKIKRDATLPLKIGKGIYIVRLRSNEVLITKKIKIL